MPTPGDPTKIILSTEDTRACPVSVNLVGKKQSCSIKLSCIWFTFSTTINSWKRLDTLLLCEPDFLELQQQQGQLEWFGNKTTQTNSRALKPASHFSISDKCKGDNLQQILGSWKYKQLGMHKLYLSNKDMWGDLLMTWLQKIYIQQRMYQKITAVTHFSLTPIRTRTRRQERHTNRCALCIWRST